MERHLVNAGLAEALNSLTSCLNEKISTENEIDELDKVIKLQLLSWTHSRKNWRLLECKIHRLLLDLHPVDHLEKPLFPHKLADRLLSGTKYMILCMIQRKPSY